MDEKPRRFTTEEWMLGVMRLALSYDVETQALYETSSQLTNDERLSLITSLARPTAPGDSYQRMMAHLLDAVDPHEVVGDMDYLLNGSLGSNCTPEDHLREEIQRYGALKKVLLEGISKVEQALDILQRELTARTEAET